MSETKSTLEQLYNETIKIIKEGEVIKGKIVSVRNKDVIVDVGFKSEGVVTITEFNTSELQVGREIEFFVESIEDDSGSIVLSREKASRIHGWGSVMDCYNKGDLIEGKPMKKVKGGFLVDVMGIEGFLPSSLSAFKNVADRDILSKPFKFKIIKVNKLRYSVILSRKEAAMKEREEAKEKIWQDLKVGSIYPGLVKAITDFGAFIDLGGVDGLLYITDMSWSKISHPSEVVAVGDKIEVLILNVDKESGKISLGLKQRFPDPWQDIETKYSVGAKVKGKIVNIVPYGIFVEIENGIEGLIHISEISWTKKISNPVELFAIGDTIESHVISIDKDARKIALSIKQLEQNPWQDIEGKYTKGTRVHGKVKGFTKYGVFVELDNSIEGMVHISDISWTKRVVNPQDILKKGQKVEVEVLSVDAQNQRIALGLKQLQTNPWPEIAQKYPLNSTVEAEVSNITDFGVFVKIEEDLEGLIFANEINQEQLKQLKPQDKIKAKVIKVDTEQGKIGLSAKVENV
ncbi:MAG: 30S ribosomal protein S1 [Candidatus Omnitrophota bacterium]|jgi:small subunit ribosomal protein S1|nr:MAG: 30S ribosomal protein S1 [Candidatus Omnitrophota bacterium]